MEAAITCSYQEVFAYVQSLPEGTAAGYAFNACECVVARYLRQKYGESFLVGCRAARSPGCRRLLIIRGPVGGPYSFFTLDDQLAQFIYRVMRSFPPIRHVRDDVILSREQALSFLTGPTQQAA